MPQSAAIDWHLPISCSEVVEAGWKAQVPWWKPRGGGRKAAVKKALEMVKLQDMAHKPPSALSGGQRQRLLIARSLIQGSKVLLLDEPLSSLDKATRESLAQILEAVCEQEGTSLIIASHEVVDFPCVLIAICILTKVV